MYINVNLIKKTYTYYIRHKNTQELEYGNWLQQSHLGVEMCLQAVVWCVSVTDVIFQ